MAGRTAEVGLPRVSQASATARRVTHTPRRARCGDCGRTQILLPTELTVRRADTTEAIGDALVAKANGAGHRAIAAGLDRPASTVRRWLRGARGAHAQWLYQQGMQKVVAVDRDLLTRLARSAPHSDGR